MCALMTGAPAQARQGTSALAPPAPFRHPAAEGTVATGCQRPAPAEGMGSEGVTQPLEGSHKPGGEESSVQTKHPGGKAVWW